MLWQKKDAGLHAYFIGQINDPEEKKRAWKRYDEIRGFVESNTCRHERICGHFGENKKWTNCGACDACGYEPGWLAAPVKEPPRRRKGSNTPALAPVRAVVTAKWERPGQPPVAAQAQEDSDLDPFLRDFLREWRKDAANQQNVPAFVVLHDTTLDQICRRRPASIADLKLITGIGERKAELYGKQILDALKRFKEGARASVVADKKITPSEETMRLIEKGKTLDEIAVIRGRRRSTIVSMVSDLVERGLLEYDESWVSQDRQEKIELAVADLGTERYSPIKEALPEEFTYDEIRLVVAKVRRQRMDSGNNQSLAATT
jgi:ATP-dependent DNA helicase RecQ